MAKKGASGPENNHTLREEAEKRLFKRPETGRSHDDPLSLVHELEVHRIELEMQNEELRESRLEVEASREKYFDLYDLAPVAYLTLDEKGVISELNLAAAELLGATRARLSNRPFSRYVAPQSREAFSRHQREAHGSSMKQVCELELRKHDGTLFHARLDSMGVEMNGRRAMRTALTDITERARAQEALREKEERYRSLFESSLDGIMLTQSDGPILAANGRVCEMLLMTEEEILRAGRSGVMVDDERLRAAIQERAKTGRWRGELTARRKDGSTFPVEISSNLFTGAQGTEMSAIVMRDITARKEVEEQIRSLLAEKELLLKEHRIKNNMSVVVGLLSLHAGRLTDPSAVSSLGDAENRVRSMMVLYDKLYRSADFRNISGKAYLSSLINEIIGNFPNRDAVSVVTEIDDIILDAKILSPLGIILNELLTNAMKHAFVGRNNGALAVSFSMQDNHATLMVRDDGVGVPESMDMENPAGFGLHVVRMLTEQIDGAIRLERWKGSTFILEFEA